MLRAVNAARTSRREVLRRPGAQEHQLRLQREDHIEMRHGQLREACGCEVIDDAVGRDDAVPRDTYLIDADPGLGIAAYQVDARPVSRVNLTGR